MTTAPRLLPALVLIAAAVAAGCSGSAATTQPTAPPSGPPSGPPVPITTPEAAMAAVVAVEPRFAGIGPRQPDLIGQSAWYEAKPASGVGAFVVIVTVGWGDCQAGCIERHTWTYGVAPDGTVTTLSETGDPVPPGVLPTVAPTGTTGIAGRATAGPVCPVERPGDPTCDPRPVANAEIVVQDLAGGEVARTRTNTDGTFSLPVPAGDYLVVGLAAEGLMGAPGPQPVTVTEGQVTSVELAYDTGIR